MGNVGLHQLLNGHLLRAFGLNPLMVLSLPFVGYAFLSNAMTMVNGRRLPTVFIPAIWIWMLLGACPINLLPGGLVKQ